MVRRMIACLMVTGLLSACGNAPANQPVPLSATTPAYAATSYSSTPTYAAVATGDTQSAMAASAPIAQSVAPASAPFSQDASSSDAMSANPPMTEEVPSLTPPVQPGQPAPKKSFLSKVTDGAKSLLDKAKSLFKRH